MGLWSAIKRFFIGDPWSDELKLPTIPPPPPVEKKIVQEESSDDDDDILSAYSEWSRKNLQKPKTKVKSGDRYSFGGFEPLNSFVMLPVPLCELYKLLYDNDCRFEISLIADMTLGWKSGLRKLSWLNDKVTKFEVFEPVSSEVRLRMKECGFVLSEKGDSWIWTPPKSTLKLVK